MKILVVTQYFYPENFKINDLVQSLVQRGHKIDVLTGLPNYPSGKWYDGFGLTTIGEYAWEGARIYRVPMVPRFSSKGWQLAINYFSFAYIASILAPFMCRAQYDRIFVYEPSPFTVGFPAMVMRKVKSAPLVFWVQDLWPESLSATGAVKSGWILKLIGSMVRKIYRACDHVLVQSRGFIEPAIRAGADPQRISYFPNWAEDFYIPKKPSVTEISIPEGFKVMFAGNMGAAQSLDTIVEAMRTLKDKASIRWIMIGDGRRKQWMQDRVKEYGLDDTVCFTGRLPPEHMPDYFAHANVMLATLADDEIFSYTVPAKIQTYMACGKPLIVALNGEGNRIVQESGAGYAVPAGDGRALADAVLDCYNKSEDERAVMGMAALEYSRLHFNKQRLIVELEEILDKTEVMA